MPSLEVGGPEPRGFYNILFGRLERRRSDQLPGAGPTDLGASGSSGRRHHRSGHRQSVLCGPPAPAPWIERRRPPPAGRPCPEPDLRLSRARPVRAALHSRPQPLAMAVPVRHRGPQWARWGMPSAFGSGPASAAGPSWEGWVEPASVYTGLPSALKPQRDPCAGDSRRPAGSADHLSQLMATGHAPTSPPMSGRPPPRRPMPMRNQVTVGTIRHLHGQRADGAQLGHFRCCRSGPDGWRSTAVGGRGVSRRARCSSPSARPTTTASPPAPRPSA